MAVNSFRDLRVWQAAMDLVEHVYRATECFPKAEVYGLTSQTRRAAVSVPSNIAEGHARAHTSEYLHHLSYAQASLAETETQVEIARRLGYLVEEQASKIVAESASLGRRLYALRNSLLRHSDSSDP
jgi:four helix bundle protein